MSHSEGNNKSKPLQLEVSNLNYFVDDFHLKVDLQVKKGEYFALMGETGCGKTVFMELLCGIRCADEGSLYINGTNALSLKPAQRNIGYVPQNGALFSHLSVEKNIEFGLAVRRVPKRLRQEKGAYFAELLGISHLLKRSVEMLSGGEKQRVALARALVISPSLLVLDEPVSALDELTRESVLIKLKELQKQLGLTVVHVNHSFEETLMVADSVAIMRAGRILESGKLAAILKDPKKDYSARILRCGNYTRKNYLTV